ncbi:hypothetical protein PG993_005892 [Apiospora rasikravindrae]|uniref:Uncharacterized protein n=1 Tax=Apiospora rasikravindrae TaxID=990691 RepID=A0ABR1TAP6_9PEZI
MNTYIQQRQRPSIDETMRTARDNFPSMQQLDLEIALFGGQPVDPGLALAWLCGMLERHLTKTVLETFILKLPIYLT